MNNDKYENMLKDYYTKTDEEQAEVIKNLFKEGLTDKDINEIFDRHIIKGDKIMDLNKENIDNNEGKDVIKRIEELENKYSTLNKELIKIKNNNKILNNNNDNLLMNIEFNLCRTTILKQYKIDENVASDFDIFASKYKIINKQVLMSMALKEFIEKYDKEDNKNTK